MNPWKPIGKATVRDAPVTVRNESNTRMLGSQITPSNWGFQGTGDVVVRVLTYARNREITCIE